MKPSNKMVQGIMLVLFLGVVAYFAVYAVGVFAGGYETAVVYNYSSQRTIFAQGYLIREETVLQEGGNLEEIVVAEGENVAVGDTVAHVYDNQEALEQHRELEELEQELEQLDYMRSRGTEDSDAMRLNEEITSVITDLKGDVAQGKFTTVEDQVDDLKDMIFRRDYATSTDNTISQQIQEVNSRIVQIQNATAAETSTITSPVSGIFSASVDGYESAFDIETLDDLLPDDIRAIEGKQAETSEENLGKVITSFTWYYAAIMDQEVSKRLTTGDTATVNFEGAAGTQEMIVQHLSVPDEEGKVAVIFRSSKNLSSMTLLRKQDVEVGYDSCEGLRIPAQALRADQQTGQLGVYRITGAQAQWIPVELVYSGEDYYLVKSVETADMTQWEEANRLRAGDEVLVRGKGIYDGKVVA